MARMAGVRARLFHRDALGEIARLVDVGATQHGNVVGEQLQRHGVHRRRLEMADMARHLDDVHAVAGFEPRVGISEHVQLAATRAHLHEVRLELFQQFVVRRDGDHGHVGIHQRQWPVLEFAGGVGFGVDVGNLLELERTFERHRMQCAATKEQRVLFVGEAQRELLNNAVEFQGLFNQAGQLDQVLHHFALALGIGAVVARERQLVQCLVGLPGLIDKTLELDGVIQQLALRFADKQHALFLGRGALHAVALEGALKLKEISYIHAEAYAAGELKHGPLALVDADMPVITVAPNNELLEKLKSNLMEVRARGGELYVIADADSQLTSSEGIHVLRLPEHAGLLSPIVHTIPL